VLSVHTPMNQHNDKTSKKNTKNTNPVSLETTLSCPLEVVASRA